MGVWVLPTRIFRTLPLSIPQYGLYCFPRILKTSSVRGAFFARVVGVYKAVNQLLQFSFHFFSMIRAPEKERYGVPVTYPLFPQREETKKEYAHCLEFNPE